MSWTVGERRGDAYSIVCVDEHMWFGKRKAQRFSQAGEALGGRFLPRVGLDRIFKIFEKKILVFSYWVQTSYDTISR
jgi:hypothetical protein